MIKANFKAYSTYVTDSLYQWDINQKLTVTGLNLSVAPEVHFSNNSMDKAIVKQSRMTDHIVTVDIPNSLLQQPLRIYAHIGINEGDTFKTIEIIEIPVIAKTRPADYQIQDSDEEIYSFKALENAIANMVTLSKFNVDKSTINARINAIVANNNNTNGNSELVDIRVGAYGETYGSAGSAVREQFTDINRLKTNVEIKLVQGSITNGIDEPNNTRAKFAERVKACSTIISFKKNIDYYFGYAHYDNNGIYDGIDHGWNAITAETIVKISDGLFKFNFRRIDNAAITETDLQILRDNIEIVQFDILNKIDCLSDNVNKGYPTIESFTLELGSLSNGVPVDFTTRARFSEKISVTDKTVITILSNNTYHYGYAFYDENGTYDEIDHGWNYASSNNTITFNQKGFCRMNFKRLDDNTITENDLLAIYDLIEITTSKNIQDVINEINNNHKELKNVDALDSAITSISVDYGRIEGASYVFARIPKTTNTGYTLTPIVKLTSEDSTVDGEKISALNYAKRENSVFTLNAGLFNTNTLQPVGQTIIDGVSIVNTPMVDDMGSPISDKECYPLCIDSNGDLSAPYNRNIDTSEMITDGIIYAVTGWGKVIDNFVACSDTVDNEIVHAGKYIRQVIGQFQNGDYFVCTVDMSRGKVENEAGVTYSILADFLISKGVKFAYSLDGGGSAETVIGKRQLNPIYEGDYGRNVPTVITFKIS